MKLNLIAVSICGLSITTAIAQQNSSSGGSQANQVPLSGRMGQNGSVAAQQSAVPGTTQSVDTLNSTVLVQGPYAQSVLSGKVISGPLSLREAVQLGLEYNLGALGQTNATIQAHGQMRVARSPCCRM